MLAGNTEFDNQTGAPQSRLVISKMILNDFKSYAGSQEIGPFHRVKFSNHSRSALLLVQTVLENRM